MAWRFPKSFRIGNGGPRYSLGKRGVTHKIGSGGRSRGGGSDTAWGCLAVVVIIAAVYVIGRFFH